MDGHSKCMSLLSRHVFLWINRVPAGCRHNSAICSRLNNNFRLLRPQLITRRYATAHIQSRKHPQYMPKAIKTRNRDSPSRSGAHASSASATRPLYNALISRLAEKSSPSVLYESPSNLLYIFTCYSLGGFCLSWAGYQIWDIYLFPVVEINTYVRTAMGGLCAFMVISGAYIFSKSFNIVRTISAVPVKLNNGQRSIKLRILSGNLFKRSLEMDPGEIFAYGRIHIPRKLLTPTERAQEAVASRQRWENEKKRIWTLPFRQMWKGFKTFQEVIFNERWVFLKVPGRTLAFKVDKNPTWAMEEGRVLDAIVKHVR